MLFTIFKYFFSFQRKSLKYANYPIDEVIHSTKFWSDMIKKKELDADWKSTIISETKADICKR